MPILKASVHNPGLLDAVDESGEIVATGYLQVPVIPDGPGEQICDSIQFVVSKRYGANAEGDEALKALGGS